MEIILKEKNKLNNLKSLLKEYSFSLGFNKIGFAKPKLLEKEFENYLRWLQNGYQASMYYLEKNLDRRQDLRKILPEIRSVVVFAHSYYTPHHHTSNLFKISRYAWGNDYHTIIYDKLKQVVEFLKKYVFDFKFKIYVDTGPILEKFWAVESGIGWQGKNSLVLNKELGSYFFIGILLTSLDFEPDPKVKEHCGNCTRCMDFCPTKAIVQPKVIDSRKCISFWTIEKKVHEEIPEEIDLSGWIFGCDICQEVCPWNKKALETSESEFLPFRFGTNLKRELIENLTKEKFIELTRKSPIRRAKFEGLVKNYKHILKKL